MNRMQILLLCELFLCDCLNKVAKETRMRICIYMIKIETVSKIKNKNKRLILLRLV
jgi:hypothetical protein